MGCSTCLLPFAPSLSEANLRTPSPGRLRPTPWSPSRSGAAPSRPNDNAAPPSHWAGFSPFPTAPPGGRGIPNALRQRNVLRSLYSGKAGVGGFSQGDPSLHGLKSG